MTEEVEEIEELSEDFDENYELFIADALDTGCVWALEGEEGFALCPSVDSEDIDVMPLWSQPEYAQVHSKDEWAKYEVVPIATEELLDEWLEGLHGDLILVGVNWNEAMEGVEIEPLDLLEDIDKASSD
jgi:hypothetical protein